MYLIRVFIVFQWGIGYSFHNGIKESVKTMKNRPLKIILAILEIFWSLPLIGLIIILSPIFSVIMIVMHGIVFVKAWREGVSKAGNILGLIASFFVFIAFIISGGDILYGMNTPDLFLVVMSWPVHILSAIFIFVGLSKDKKTFEQSTKENLETHQEKVPYIKQHDEQLQAPILTVTQEAQVHTQLNTQQLLKKQALLQEKERFKKAILLLLTSQEKGLSFAIDTSFLIDRFHYALLQYLLEKERITIYICTPVVEELNRLKSGGSSIGKAARDALGLMNTYQKTQQIIFVETPEMSFLHGYHLTNEHIDRVIGSYLQKQLADKLRFVLLINDTERGTKAIEVGLQVVDIEE